LSCFPETINNSAWMYTVQTRNGDDVRNVILVSTLFFVFKVHSSERMRCNGLQQTWRYMRAVFKNIYILDMTPYNLVDIYLRF
jgi:hypothetical protein